MTRSLRRLAHVALLGSFAFLPVFAWAAGKPSCLGDFAKLIEGGLSPAGARAVNKAYRRYAPKAQKGLLSIIAAEPAVARLEPDVLEDIFGNFKPGVEFDFNPLKTDEGLFEAIGDLTDQGADGVLRMREGLTETISDLGGTALKAQGASFDLFMAKEVGFARTVGFQKRTPVPGTSRTRVTDLVEECSGNCGDLGGILHENKNFTTPMSANPLERTNPPIDPAFPDYFKYGDNKLDTLASEFAEDILIHRNVQFNSYRLNLRAQFSDTPAQRELLRTILSQQFDSPLLKRVILDAAERDGIREFFLANIDSFVKYR